MDLVKKIAGFAAGFIIVYVLIHVFKGSDKLDQFQEFRSDEGRFTVMMPGKPKTDNQTLESPVGKINMVMFTAGSSKAGCFVAYADYPEQLISSTDPQKLLEGAKNGAIANVKGKLISEASIDFHGFPAKEVNIEIPNKAFVTARFILTSPRFYELMFIAPKDIGHEDDIRQFFNSFKIDGVK